MKKKLNILCTITLLILFVCVAGNFVSSIPSFCAGFRDGYHIKSNIDKDKKGGKDTNTMHNAKIGEYSGNERMKTKEYINTADMCFNIIDTRYPIKAINKLNGKSMNVWPCRISIPYHKPFWMNVLEGILVLEIIIVGIWALVLFFILIFRLNKTNDIFSWKNVRLLREIGIMSLIYALPLTIYQFMEVYQASKEVALQGFIINYSDCFESTAILLGLVSLIFAEIFAVGLRLQKEQELTI